MIGGCEGSDSGEAGRSQRAGLKKGFRRFPGQRQLQDIWTRLQAPVEDKRARKLVMSTCACEREYIFYVIKGRVWSFPRAYLRRSLTTASWTYPFEID